MADKDWLDGYDPVAAGEQDEWGNDLEGLRYNLSLTPGERIEQHRCAATSLLWLEKLRHVPRSATNRPTS